MSKEIETAAVAAGGGLLVWFGKALWGRRRAKIDLLQAQVDTLLKIITGQDKYIKALELRVEKLEARVMEQDAIIHELRYGK